MDRNIHIPRQAMKEMSELAADLVRDGLAANTLSVFDQESLLTDDGLEVKGVAVWLVNDEIRTYTGCLHCSEYVEYAIPV